MMCKDFQMKRKAFREIIEEDRAYYFGGKIQLYRYLTHNPLYRRGVYIITCRKLGYHQACSGIMHKMLSLYYQRKKNVLGELLHIELGPDIFGRRLKIYHNDIIVNAGVVIGDDVELYGNNCIGNKGSRYDPLAAPVIGNNVSFGVGASAIGKITICDDVVISSLTLVNKDITEKGLYGGVPARLINRKV